jgi:hypothetical protein
MLRSLIRTESVEGITYNRDKIADEEGRPQDSNTLTNNCLYSSNFGTAMISYLEEQYREGFQAQFVAVNGHRIDKKGGYKKCPDKSYAFGSYVSLQLSFLLSFSSLLVNLWQDHTTRGR